MYGQSIPGWFHHAILKLCSCISHVSSVSKTSFKLMRKNDLMNKKKSFRFPPGFDGFSLKGSTGDIEKR